MSGSSWPALVAGQKAKASEVEAKFDWLEEHIVPMSGGSKTDATYDLGESTFRWRDVWVSRNVLAATAIASGTTSPSTYLYNQLVVATSSGNSGVSFRCQENGQNFVGFTDAESGAATPGRIRYQHDALSTSERMYFTVGGQTDILSLGVDDLSLSKATAGSGVAIQVENTDNSSVFSTAYFRAVVGGGSAGDPMSRYSVTGVTDFVIGIDNSDSDKFKIGEGASPGSGECIAMTTAGEVTLPRQPAFLAINSGTDVNVTGAGSSATIEFDTEVFDQNSDFNNTTDTFTAPVTGRYLLSTSVTTNEMSTSVTAVTLTIRTTARDHSVKLDSWGPVGGATHKGNYQLTTIADMAAGNTAQVLLTISGLAGDSIDIEGTASSLCLTSFSGILVA